MGKLVLVGLVTNILDQAPGRPGFHSFFPTAQITVELLNPCLLPNYAIEVDQWCPGIGIATLRLLRIDMTLMLALDGAKRSVCCQSVSKWNVYAIRKITIIESG